jgi:hypothetical protein
MPANVWHSAFPIKEETIFDFRILSQTSSCAARRVCASQKVSPDRIRFNGKRIIVVVCFGGEV